MSVVLEKPEITSRASVADVPFALRPSIPVEVPREPLYRPIPETTTVTAPATVPTRVRKQSGTRVGQWIVAKVTLFGVFFALTFVASTLCGQFLLERSRTQSLDAMNRARYAQRAEKSIMQRLDTLNSAASIEQWALTHGFRPSDGLGETSKVQDSGPITR